MNFMPIYGRIDDLVKMKSNTIKAQQSLLQPKQHAIKAFEPVHETEETNTQKVENLRIKLKCGKTLSSKELEYLKKHSPELYKIAVTIAKEKKEHETALRRAKTKEQVNFIQTQKQSAILSTASTVGSEVTAMRSAAINDCYSTYTNTKEYKRLPTELDVKKLKKKAKTDAQRKSNSAKEKADNLTQNLITDPKLSSQNNYIGSKHPDPYSLLEDFQNNKQQALNEKAKQQQENRQALANLRFDIDVLPNSSAKTTSLHADISAPATTASVQDSKVQSAINSYSTMQNFAGNINSQPAVAETTSGDFTQKA